MHYNTKNQKYIEQKNWIHISQNRVSYCILIAAFLKIKYYDIELLGKFIWMCIHSVNAQICKYILEKLSGSMKSV